MGITYRFFGKPCNERIEHVIVLNIRGSDKKMTADRHKCRVVVQNTDPEVFIHAIDLEFDLRRL